MDISYHLIFLRHYRIGLITPRDPGGAGHLRRLLHLSRRAFLGGIPLDSAHALLQCPQVFQRQPGKDVGAQLRPRCHEAPNERQPQRRGLDSAYPPVQFILDPGGRSLRHEAVNEAGHRG